MLNASRAPRTRTPRSVPVPAVVIFGHSYVVVLSGGQQLYASSGSIVFVVGPVMLAVSGSFGGFITATPFFGLSAALMVVAQETERSASRNRRDSFAGPSLRLACAAQLGAGAVQSPPLHGDRRITGKGRVLAAQRPCRWADRN